MSNTNILNHNIIILKEVSSTQEYIKEIPDEKKQNGLVVVAKNQTAGIGTNGRKWYTEKNKNLTFSFLLKPNCNIKKLENLTITIAQTITKVIKNLYGYDLEIKYPNDIMLKSKKMGGILTEAITSNEIVKQIIIGIGLNINQEEFEGEVKDIATSLKKEFGKEFDIEQILMEFLREFEKEYLNMIISIV